MKFLKCFAGLKWAQVFSSQRAESVKDHKNRPVTSANVNLKLYQYISSFKTIMLRNVCPCLKKLYLSKHLIFLLIALQKAME